MKKNNLKKISLNQLAEWSPWPARLLSISNFEIKHKSPDAVNREFEIDKWGALLKYFLGKDLFRLSDVEAMEQDLEELIPCYDRYTGFHIDTAKNVNDQHIKIYHDTLSQYANDASALVELGAGYGSKILTLSEFPPFNQMPLYAAEYTNSGCSLIKLIAQMSNKQIEVGHCDFNTLNIDELKIPENAIIFTSYSVHYVPELKKEFINFILKFKPKVVVHFEPCYEYYDDQTLHGLMCKRYIELNGYTKNIASTIQSECSKIEAKFEVERNIYGSNPFLPISAIKWTPQY